MIVPACTCRTQTDRARIHNELWKEAVAAYADERRGIWCGQGYRQARGSMDA